MGERVAIHEKVILPSQGLPYGGKIPSEFNLRAMSTLEEKIRLSSSNGMQVISQIIDRCKDDDSFKAEDLILSDLLAVMYRLRCITYGSDYTVNVVCPKCGNRHETTVNLDELETKPISDSFKGFLEVGPLPVSGDIIECKLLTSKDSLNIARDVKKILSKTPNYIGDPEMILRWNYIVSTINGEVIPSTFMIQEYIEKLHAKDFLYLQNRYNEFEESIGLDTTVVDICPHCENDIKFNLPITEEFFRPRC